MRFKGTDSSNSEELGGILRSKGQCRFNVLSCLSFLSQTCWFGVGNFSTVRRRWEMNMLNGRGDEGDSCSRHKREDECRRRKGKP